MTIEPQADGGRLGGWIPRRWPAPLRCGALLAVATVASSCAPAVAVTHTVSTPSGTATSTIAPLAKLAKVKVIPTLPGMPNYDRSCSPGRACSFGQAWSDDTDAPGSHDGCDSRSQAIGLAATEVVRHGPCKVVSGVLHDPYTGVDVPFTGQTVNRLNGDHLIPLKRAWDLGAAGWSQERRATFANDIDLEIIITTAAANNAKGDKGIGERQPPNVAYRCEYSTRYLAVTVAYQLPLTQHDHDTLAKVLGAC